MTTEEPMLEADVTIPRELYTFLMGEGPMDGTWFGDLNKGLRGSFWWRALLAAAERESSRTPPVDQDEVERVARAIETEIDEQTGGAWPIKVGDDLHLVDAELDLRAIARAALASIRGDEDACAG